MATERSTTPGEAEVQTEAHCNHHWIIEPAQGSTSQGVCQTCKAVREFRNSVDWEYGNRKPGRPSAEDRLN